MTSDRWYLLAPMHRISKRDENVDGAKPVALRLDTNAALVDAIKDGKVQ